MGLRQTEPGRDGNDSVILSCQVVYVYFYPDAGVVLTRRKIARPLVFRSAPDAHGLRCRRN